jgi:hypothetical protein
MEKRSLNEPQFEALIPTINGMFIAFPSECESIRGIKQRE